MKKVFFYVTLLLSLSSCSKVPSPSDEFVSLDTITCSRTVSFNIGTKGAAVRPVDLTLTTSYNVNDDVVTSFSISGSDADVDVNSLKELVKEQFEEEYGYPLENSELNGIMETVLAKDPGDSTAGCFNSCLSMKKGEGRGWCRAGCILDFIVKIIEPIVGIFD